MQSSHWRGIGMWKGAPQWTRLLCCSCYLNVMLLYLWPLKLRLTNIISWSCRTWNNNCPVYGNCFIDRFPFLVVLSKTSSSPFKTGSFSCSPGGPTSTSWTTYRTPTTGSPCKPWRSSQLSCGTGTRRRRSWSGSPSRARTQESLPEWTAFSPLPPHLSKQCV